MCTLTNYACEFYQYLGFFTNNRDAQYCRYVGSCYIEHFYLYLSVVRFIKCVADNPCTVNIFLDCVPK